MSSQQRYRTLVHHIGRIYAAPDGTRTELLQTGLDQIVSVVGPTNTATWNMVGADSDRLLKIWVAKEKDEAAATVAQQIGDLLRELAEAGDDACVPTLIVEDVVSHVPSITIPDVVEPHKVPEIKKSLVSVPEPEIKKSLVSVPEPNIKKSLEPEVKKPVVPEPQKVQAIPETKKPVVPETKKPAPAPVEDEEEYEVEEEEDGSKPPSDDEGDVIEPEADADGDNEEEEEVGMEVEQITIRGRTWWLEVNTQKIYAVVDGDDVGDEMGEMVAGKPRFYNK